MFFRAGVVLLIMVITGCSRPPTQRTEAEGVICINGVEYYKWASGYRGYLAVKINKDTLQPERCEDDSRYK